MQQSPERRMIKARQRISQEQDECRARIRIILAEHGYKIFPPIAPHRRHRDDFVAISHQPPYVPKVLLIGTNDCGGIDIRPYGSSQSCRRLVAKALEPYARRHCTVHWRRVLPKGEKYGGWLRYIARGHKDEARRLFHLGE